MRVLVSLHDVTPFHQLRLHRAERLLQELRIPEVSYLLVPDFHRCAPIERDRAFVHWCRRSRPFRVHWALHGYFHREFPDDRRVPIGIGARAQRWLLTDGEAEFFALAGDAVHERLTHGCDVFTAVVNAPPGAFVGTIPAWQAGRPNLLNSLKGGGRESTSRSWGRARTSLVVAEVALGTVVVVGAALLLKSFVRLTQVRLGFQPRGVLTMRVIPRGPKYSTLAARTGFYRDAVQKIEAIPGVRSAGAITFLPLTFAKEPGGLTVEGRSSPFPGQQPVVDYRAVTPGYFASMGIPLLAGRSFAWSDAPGSPEVAIASRALAGQFWPNEDAIGRHIKPGGPTSPGPWLTIVGIVDDVRNIAVVDDPEPTVYVPDAQNQDPRLTVRDLVVGTAIEPSSIASAARAAIRAVDRELSVSRLRAMSEVYSISVTPQRFNLQLLGLMAVLSLMLATVGLYGVNAYAVEQRTHEIGLRMALGADPRRVTALILADGGTSALLGVTIGILASLLLTRVMQGLLFGVTAVDLLTYVMVAVGVCLVVLLACFVPARRAMRIDPFTALRCE